MKREFAIALSVAAAAFTLLIPQLAQARNSGDSKASPESSASIMAQKKEAQLMVPAQTALNSTLDSSKAQPGQQLRVTISKTVRLKDGTELPRGTKILGTVASNPAGADAKSKMSLRFTKAELKDGKLIPITATIVGVYPPDLDDSEGYPVPAGDQESNTWNSSILAVDQIGPQAGLELHSKIANKYSGTLVSTKNRDVKLPKGTELALAIAVRKNS